MNRLTTILSGTAAALMLLQSCSGMEDVRNGIDSLNTRLDALQETILTYNESIEAYSDMFSGTAWIVDFIEDNGGYTVKLSDGSELRIYNGTAEEDYSPFRIGLDELSGQYVWFYGDEPYRQNGQLVPASGTDGVTPQIRVNQTGRWEFSFDGGKTWQEGDSATPRAGGLFDDVRKTDRDGNTWTEGVSSGVPCLTFTWTAGDQENIVTIPTFGGLTMTMEAELLEGGGKVFVDEIDPVKHKAYTVAAGAELTVAVRQKGVHATVIESAVGFAVRISIDSSATEEVSGTMSISPLAGTAVGDYNIFVKIFSPEGFARLVTVPVTVTDPA